MGDFHTVICGGGVAATEGLLRLRTIAGDSVNVTLVAPHNEFVSRPLAVHQAVAPGWGRRYELGKSPSGPTPSGSRTAASVDPHGRIAHTGTGHDLRYDALLVAVGGRQLAELDHATIFGDAEAGQV